MGALQSDVVGLEIVVFGCFDGSCDGLGLAWRMLVLVLKRCVLVLHTSKDCAIEHRIAGYINKSNIGG